MKITIQSIHFTAQKKLNDFIQEKVGKLSQHHPAISAADVSIKIDKSDNRDNKVAEVKLILPGNALFAKKQEASFEESIVAAVAALEHQLEKIKLKPLPN